VSTGFHPWLEAFTLGQVCRQTRHEYRPLALRAQQIVTNLDVLPRYLSGLYSTPESFTRSTSPRSLLVHIFGCACTPRPGTPVIFDILPLIRMQHGETLVTVYGGKGRCRLKKRVVHINDFIRYADARWIDQWSSGRIATVIVWSGTSQWQEPFCGITRVVIVFKRSLAPDYFREELVRSDSTVCYEGVIDRFAEDMGWVKTPRLDIHISVEGRCNQVWSTWPTSKELEAFPR
jgi:hypothetical protein